jgi:phosphinothricin acetyltransferase
MIDNMLPSDWESVRAIYSEGINTGHATLETDPGDWTTWNNRHLAAPRLVYRQNNRVLGWAALTPVSSRCVYDGVAEVSVYVAKNVRRKGIGIKLLRELITESESTGIWTLQASIFPENEASVRLHQTCGFRQVGRWTRLGKLNEVWRDIIQFEYRSQIVGL